MCIIAIKPKGKKMFTEKEIDTMFSNNPHGCGYMYYDNKRRKVMIKKGFMSNKALMDDLNKKDLTNTNVILHFRISTSGLIDSLNCHPYPVGAKNKVMCAVDLGLAHNGILHDYTPVGHSRINDTQIFIREVLNPLKKNWHYDKDKLSLIKTIIGDRNKLALLDSNNKVIMIGDFIEDNGYYYSNNSYKEKPKYSNYCGYYKNPSEYANAFIDIDYDDDEDDEEESWFWKDYDERHAQ